MNIVGIDLAGSEKRKTGFCILDKHLNCSTKILYKDKEIIDETIKAKPRIIAIDAPLSLPLGRKSLEERRAPHLRKCDRELLQMKIKFFPITLGPMRKLTKRGMKLKKIFEKRKFKVIEVFPGATQDILGIPRKQKSLRKLRFGLKRLGIVFKNKKMSGDELDAITCALTGLFYLKGNYIALGNKKEGQIIVPKIE
jgi:hypothetical protein